MKKIFNFIFITSLTMIMFSCSADRLKPIRSLARSQNLEKKSSTQRRIVRLSSIANDPRLQPPVGVWAVSQSQWGWSSSQTS